MIYTTQSGVSACFSCFQSEVQSLLTESKLDELAAKFTTRELTDLLSKPQFEGYLEATLKQLLATSGSFVTCPKCDVAIEITTGDLASEREFLETQRGLDGRELTPQTMKHCLEHRITCRSCLESFCSSCLSFPYHMGFTCSGYHHFRHSEHCRFCDSSCDSLDDAPEDEEESGFLLIKPGTGPRGRNALPISDLSKGFYYSAWLEMQNPSTDLLVQGMGWNGRGQVFLGVSEGRLLAAVTDTEGRTRRFLGPSLPLRALSKVGIEYTVPGHELRLSASYSGIPITAVTAHRRTTVQEEQLRLVPREEQDKSRTLYPVGFLPGILLQATMLGLVPRMQADPVLATFEASEDLILYILWPVHKQVRVSITHIRPSLHPSILVVSLISVSLRKSG